jgi:outer membrane protein assembly factor BamB
MRGGFAWNSAVVLWTAMSLAAPGSDWPCWRGPAGTGGVPEGERVPPALSAELKVLWRVPVAQSLGSPVVRAGRLYHLDAAADRETVHALDAATGKELWSQALDELHKDTQSVPAPRTTPTADGDRVYVQSCRGEFRCLSSADGHALWRVNFVKDFNAVYVGESGSATGASRHGYTGSPVIDGDRIYVSVGGTNGSSVVCFSKADGRIVWKSQDDVPGYGAPAVAALGGVRQLVAFTSAGVMGVDCSDGRLLWRFPVQTSFGRHVVTPLVLDDRVVVSSHQAGLIGLRVSAAADGRQNAEPAWISKTATINYACPVLVGRHLYGIGPSGRLICVDVKTGQTAWEQGRFTPERLQKDYAAFLVMDKRILVLADNGYLTLFEADPTAYRMVSQTRACAHTWCSPAYADGKLYLRDEQEMICVSLD